ncbi:MAG: hypothetical protein ABH871_08790 [Pseudomonadota bacterium]
MCAIKEHMGYFALRRPSGIMYAIALAGLVFMVGFTKIVGFDVWWHLATGWIIANMHQIPRTDIFSYTAFGSPWVNHEWLYELLQWFIYKFGGTLALTVMKFLITAAISWLLFMTLSLVTLSRSAAIWGVVIFIWGASYRIMDRPFLLGMLLLTFFCFTLHKYLRDGTKLIWSLPFLQIFWINSHGGGLLGVETVLAFALGESIQNVSSLRLGAVAAIPAKSRSKLWIVGLLCVIGSFINPWGANIYLFYREHAQMSTILAQTQEWLPLLHTALDGLIPPLIFIIILFLTLLSFIINARNARISHLLLTALTSAILFMGHRFGPEFLIVNLPILFHNMKGLVAKIPIRRPAGYTCAWVNLALALVLSVTALTYGIPMDIKGNIFNEVGVGAVAKFAPSRMVDFLEYYKIDGQVLNDMGLGGYLIFRRWPAKRVFIDGRTPVYGDEFYRAFVDTTRNSRNFEELDQQYKFDYLVFAAYQAWNLRHFHKYLWENPTWKLVYAGNDGFVYLRKDGKNRKLIKKLELKESPIVKMMIEEESKQR